VYNGRSVLAYRELGFGCLVREGNDAFEMAYDLIYFWR
jgi:hypothetical protein